MSDSESLNLEAALAYVERGWSVLPIHSAHEGQCSCGRTDCEAAGKHPRTPQGVKNATTDSEEIRNWLKSFPDANLGIATGWRSGVVVLDVDPRHGDDDSLSHLEHTYGELPRTVEALTGGGGRHIYFQHPGGAIKNKLIAPGLDVKADGGYVVAPPSAHVSGRTYAWESASHPDDVAPTKLPPWLLAKLTKGTGEQSEASTLVKIPEGARNTTLASLAGTMRQKGMTYEAIEVALLQENTHRCHPPLSDQEVKTIAASIAHYPVQSETKVNSRFPISPDRVNRANVQTKEFRLTELKTLLAEPTEERPWLIDGLLPRAGISILGAKPKVGKSTFARNMALSVVRGEPFVERTTVRGSVVYLALEEKRPEVQRHFQRLGAGEEPVFIHVGAAPDEAMAALAAAITKHKPVFAIIDPLLKLVRVTNANDYAEVSRALEPLIELARMSGCHLLCVHHLGKGERSGPDALLGSTALFAAPDTLLMMQRHDQIRTLQTIQRYGEDLPETVVGFEIETGRVTLGGTLALVQLELCMREVLQTIGHEERTEPQIKEAVGGNQTTVAKAIRQLVETRQVERDGAGKKGDPFRYRRSRSQADARLAQPSEPGPQLNREYPESRNGHLQIRLSHGVPDDFFQQVQNHCMRFLAHL